MADMRFSCPECGQHFACSEAWGGHQLQCPTCRSGIVVPKARADATAVPPPVPPPAAPAAGAKLAAGVTQVPRSPAPPPAAAHRAPPPRPKADNALLKYGLLFVVVLALGGLAYNYGLPLISGALEKEPAAQTPANASASPNAGRRPGPMGDVNEAMDVSDALDSGASPKPRRAPGTNTPARR